MITVNGKPVTAKEFAWDECHKIYLINSEKDREELLDCEYKSADIGGLQEAWDNSCSLRFISSGDLSHGLVKQGAEEPIIREV